MQSFILASMGLAPGSEIQRYVVESQIAQGGAAKVYVVRHVTLGTHHALKVLYRTTPGLTEALVREGRMQARLDPQFVIPVTDVLTVDGAPALVMPFVEGCTLSQLLAVHRPSDADVSALFTVMAKGVASAHAQGIVHRDLKPSNVMLDLYHGRVRVRVTDFGLARWSDGPRGDRTKVFQGTPSYAAPEQFRDTDGVSVQADLWSLGVILYRLLTGRRPFGGGSLKDIYARVRKGEYDDSLLKPKWRGLVRGLLSVSPADRGPVAAAIPEVLRSIIAPSPLLVSGNIARVVRILYARRDQARKGATQAHGGSTDTILEPHDAALKTLLQQPTDETIAESRSASLFEPGLPAKLVPAERDAFVGRTQDLEKLEKALEGDASVVSVVGAGGVGKTRLAVHYAHRRSRRWPGGVWFCDLADARSPDGAASAVASALGIPIAKGDAHGQLARAIAARGRCLVILDNFEQLAAYVEQTLLRWLAESEVALFLVTTRQVLGVGGERVVSLDALPPGDAEELFLNRLRERDPSFEPSLDDVSAIRTLVELLDFLPLAIELASARARIMSPRKLLGRMGDRFRLLKSSVGRPKRQATLLAALDWSWELLRPWERAALSELSVFEGGFDLEGAEAVVELGGFGEAPWTVDVVQSLVDKSLLRAVGDGRFDMLKSVHEYAANKLEMRGERQLVEQRHGVLYARFGSDEAITALHCHGGVALWHTLKLERDNLIASCQRAVLRGDAEVAGRTLRAAWVVMLNVGPFAIVQSLAERVLAMESLPNSLRANVLHISGLTARRAGKPEQAAKCYGEMLQLAEESQDLDTKCRAITSAGVLKLVYGEREVAKTMLEQAAELARDAGNLREESVVLSNLGFLLCMMGDASTAEQHCTRALSLSREVGDRMFEQLVHSNLGTAYRAQGRLEEAWSFYEQAIALGREIGTPHHVGVSLAKLGGICHELGRFDTAIEYFEQALLVARKVGSKEFTGVHQIEMAACLYDKGAFERSRDCLLEALPLMRDRRPIQEGVALGMLAVLQVKAGERESALHSVGQAETILRAAGGRQNLARFLAQSACVHAIAGSPDEAREALYEALSLEEELGRLDTVLQRRLDEARSLIG